MKPTSLPWTVNSADGFILGPRNGCSSPIIAQMPVWFPHKAPGEHVSQDLQQANAELIVQAVNSHAALVAACKEALDWIETPTRPWAATADQLREALRLAGDK